MKSKQSLPSEPIANAEKKSGQIEIQSDHQIDENSSQRLNIKNDE